jgi:hypothetical protein
MTSLEALILCTQDCATTADCGRCACHSLVFSLALPLTHRRRAVAHTPTSSVFTLFKHRITFHA